MSLNYTASDAKKNGIVTLCTLLGEEDQGWGEGGLRYKRQNFREQEQGKNITECCLKQMESTKV